MCAATGQDRNRAKSLHGARLSRGFGVADENHAGPQGNQGGKDHIFENSAVGPSTSPPRPPGAMVDQAMIEGAAQGTRLPRVTCSRNKNENRRRRSYPMGPRTFFAYLMTLAVVLRICFSIRSTA